MNKPLAALAFALSLCIGVASAQIQRGPVLPPTEQQQRAQEALRRQQAEQAEREAREAEAERQRLEQLTRQAETDRNRPHRYHVTCRVSQIIVSPERVGISCAELRDRMHQRGGPYTGEAYPGRDLTVFIDAAATPAFATHALQIATISYTDRARVRLEMATAQGAPRDEILTQISIDRGEGCTPACPP